MKSKIKNKSLLTGLIMMFLMLFTVTSYSQSCTGNQVTVTLQNITNPTNTTNTPNTTNTANTTNTINTTNTYNSSNHNTDTVVHTSEQ